MITDHPHQLFISEILSRVYTFKNRTPVLIGFVQKSNWWDDYF